METSRMEILPLSGLSSLPHDNIKFLHSVGTSTLKYGITIPIEVQTDRMLSISKGGKVPVTILFGDKEPVVAEIRRLNNTVGHLQFRYENKAQERLRLYLTGLFASQLSGNLLEVEEVSPFTFTFRPILRKSSPHLHINDMLLHRIERHAIDHAVEVEEINEAIASVKYDATYNQAAYNKRINEDFARRGWNCEQKVNSELGLRCDFEKKGIWVEVEFGNARSYYQDYVKFMLAKKYRDARLGVLICPTKSFAALLCELGRKRAQNDIVREQPAKYSGMMSYEKAVRELPLLGFMFEMPIVVAGIDIAGQNAEEIVTKYKGGK